MRKDKHPEYQRAELEQALRNLIRAIEKVGDWDEETRVGQALIEAHKALE